MPQLDGKRNDHPQLVDCPGWDHAACIIFRHYRKSQGTFRAGKWERASPATDKAYWSRLPTARHPTSAWRWSGPGTGMDPSARRRKPLPLTTADPEPPSMRESPSSRPRPETVQPRSIRTFWTPSAPGDDLINLSLIYARHCQLDAFQRCRWAGRLRYQDVKWLCLRTHSAQPGLTTWSDGFLHASCFFDPMAVVDGFPQSC